MKAAPKRLVLHTEHDFMQHRQNPLLEKKAPLHAHMRGSDDGVVRPPHGASMLTEIRLGRRREQADHDLACRFPSSCGSYST